MCFFNGVKIAEKRGAAAPLRTAKVKTHLPPHAIQSPKRWQEGGGGAEVECGGGEGG